MIKTFEQNDKGKDYVVGDIHGCFTSLQGELDKLEFNPETDRLFSVGDLVDRGPESDQVCDWLAKPWFHAVLGNHEQMAIDYSKGMGEPGDYTSNGGLWFVSLDKYTRGYYTQEFERLPLVIEVHTPTGLVGIVHAECPLKDWNELKSFIPQFKDMILWSRHRINRGYNWEVSNISKVYVGHTPVKSKKILGNHHYIDTGAVYGHPFTIERIN